MAEILTDKVAAEVTRGRAQRKISPRRTLATLAPSTRSATEILVEQNRDRLPELVPLRFARMLTNPFSFYRGAAAVMATDLAAGESSEIEVMCSGDAHIANFAIYASIQRSLVFGLNDFDEAAIAPAEWDLKRLITSAILGARQAGYPEKTVRGIATDAVRRYRDGLDEMLDLTVLDRYYLRWQPHFGQAVPAGLAATIAQTERSARTKTSAGLFPRIMETGPDGRLTLREDPPILTSVSESEKVCLTEAFGEYVAAVRADVAVLLSQFQLIALARRVVGVGSVGTRGYLLILTGIDGAPLILQVKQANRSVLEEYGHRRQPESALVANVQSRGEGQRVVDGQYVLQSMADVFLGALRIGGRDYYLRQFHDMKGRVATEGMTAEVFGQYVSACASSLARAHTQSANAPMLRGYIGNDGTFETAVLEWSYAYAEKTVDDYHQLRTAAKAGLIPVADDT